MFDNSWDEILSEEMNKDYFHELWDFINNEYQNYVIYPKKDDLFTALKLTDFNKVRVVIVGQDPYHEPNQAHGLAFSVLEGNKLPPSLKNIYKEIEAEFGYKMSNNGNLTKWANQGVLLLNNVLTVREHLANSHRKKGWEKFTNAIIKKLNEDSKQKVFVFWGNNAKEKEALVTNPKHLILKAPHPSPLSAYQGFFGCNHFLRINSFLTENGLEEIDFQI